KCLGSCRICHAAATLYHWAEAGYPQGGIWKERPWGPTLPYLPELLASRKPRSCKCVLIDLLFIPVNWSFSPCMYLSLEKIATWPTQNYVNPSTRGPVLIIMHLVLYLLILGLVALRTYTRLRISRSLGLDNVFTLFVMARSKFCCKESFRITR